MLPNPRANPARGESIPNISGGQRSAEPATRLENQMRPALGWPRNPRQTARLICGKLRIARSVVGINPKTTGGRKFTAVFLIQCLEAIGASSLRLSDG